MSNWLVGKKYDDLLRKKREYKGEEEENDEKREIFTVLGGKKSFRKKTVQWGKNILFWAIYTPLDVDLQDILPLTRG